MLIYRNGRYIKNSNEFLKYFSKVLVILFLFNKIYVVLRKLTEKNKLKFSIKHISKIYFISKPNFIAEILQIF